MFSPQAEALLTQHVAHSGLGPTEVALCEWVAYATIHSNHALSFSLFSNLLDKLVKPIQTSSLCEEDIKLFWTSTKKLLPSCFNTVRKIRKKTNNEKAAIKQLLDVLKILNKLSMLELPKDLDLFPAKSYGWMSDSNEEGTRDIPLVLKEAVTHSANDWFNHILENNARNDNTDDGKLQYLIRIIQLIKIDLQKAIEYYDKMFQENVNLQYAKTLYTLYQVRVATLAEPEITAVCKSQKRLSFVGKAPSENETEKSSDTLNVGTALFELYLTVQRFVV